MFNNVRQVLTAAELERVKRLRYSVFVDELGKAPMNADHDNGLLGDDYDDWSEIKFIAATKDGHEHVTATIRHSFLSNGKPRQEHRDVFSLDLFERTFTAEKLSITSRLAVAKPWRRSRITFDLFLEAFHSAAGRGIKFNFITASPALVPFYEKWGWRRFSHRFVFVDCELQVPLVLLADDVPHLRACESPFLRVAAPAGNCDSYSKWFESQFGQYPFCGPADGFDVELAVRKVTDAILASSNNISPALPLIETAVRSATKHRFTSGETILRHDDISYVMYIIMSGSVLVSYREDDKRTKLAEGDVLCTPVIEYFPVVQLCAEALTDVDVIAIPAQSIVDALQKLIDRVTP